MQQSMIRFVFVISVILVTGCTAPSFEERIDALLTPYQSPRPGLALRLVRGEQIVIERTIGLAELDSMQTVGATTNFRLASITKHLTALAILMLVEDGRLTLDTRLNEVLTQFPEYAERISIQHLLQHQSGLPDYEPLVSLDRQPRIRDQGVVNLLQQINQLDFEPGTSYHYSNSGYAVLTVIVETITGQAFETFLEERIFNPSKMSQSVAFVQGQNEVLNRAMGYTVRNAEIIETDQSAYSAVLGDGGVYSSIADLTTWHRVGFGRALISDRLFSAMMTPALERYGFGWRIDQFEGHTRYHHSGSTSGFRNFIAHFPDLDLTLIILTNRAGPDVLPIGEEILRLYFEQVSI